MGRVTGRWVLAFLFWGGGFYALLLTGGAGDGGPSMPDPGEMASLSLPANELWAVRYVRCDPLHERRPVLSFSFERLSVHNGDIGPFKTGAFKRAEVSSLCIRRFAYADEGADADKYGWARAGQDDGGSTGLQGLFPPQWLVGRAANGSPAIEVPDLGGVAEAEVIDGFQYQLITPAGPAMSIASRGAVCSFREDGVLLRGGVVVTVADGSRLRANRVQWEPRAGVFTVDGNYLLVRGDLRTGGRGIRLDEQLNPAGTLQARLDSGGKGEIRYGKD